MKKTFIIFIIGQIASKVKETDLDENEETVEILRDLLHEYDDPKIKHFKDKFQCCETIWMRHDRCPEVSWR